MARSRILEADAWGYGVYVAMVVDEAQGDRPDNPDARLMIWQEGLGRRVTDDCLLNVHLGCPDLADWGKA